MEKQVSIALLAGLFTVLGAIIVSVINVRNVNHQLGEAKKKEASKFAFDECKVMLERAYELFVSQGNNPPKNDHLIWVLTARTLLEFHRMKQRITEQEHKMGMSEHEEYWQRKFRDVLRLNKDQLGTRYFEEASVLPIPVEAILVILDFARWRKPGKDLLSEIDKKQLMRNVERVLVDLDGVLEYMMSDTKLRPLASEMKNKIKTGTA